MAPRMIAVRGLVACLPFFAEPPSSPPGRRQLLRSSAFSTRRPYKRRTSLPPGDVRRHGGTSTGSSLGKHLSVRARPHAFCAEAPSPRATAVNPGAGGTIGGGMRYHVS